MYNRYPAPVADDLFSDPARINRWTGITKAYARNLLIKANRHDLVDELMDTVPPKYYVVDAVESQYGHDVVAFLQQFTLNMSDDLLPFIHYGLTSSDIVDNAHFEALRLHTNHMYARLNILKEASLHPSLDDDLQSQCAGRTHGRIAEATSWKHRFHVWRSVLDSIQRDVQQLGRTLEITKSPGPTGQSVLRGDPKFIGYEKVPSTQVIPRDYQLRWAAVYLRLCTHVENLALLIRLGARSEVGEVREGAARNRVGSSAMPGKKNPITSERLCGMARLARGHFVAIAETVALWEDRDLTNSVVERTAVPQLAALTEYMVASLTKVLNDLEFFPATMQENIDERAYTNLMQSLFQKTMKIGPVQASETLRTVFDNVPRDEWIDHIMREIRLHRSSEEAEGWAMELDDKIDAMKEL